MDDAKEHAAKVDLSLDKAEADGRVIMQQIVDMGKQRKLVNSKVYMVGLSSFICQQLVLAVVMNAGTKG